MTIDGVLIIIFQFAKRTSQACLARLVEGLGRPFKGLLATVTNDPGNHWTGHFRRAVEWDPLGIACRIVVIQVCWIVGLWVWCGPFVALPRGHLIPGIDMILWGSDEVGIGESVALLVNSLCSAWVIFKIVQRSKMVADYVATMFILHATLVILYTGLVPLSPLWWTMMFLGGAIVFMVSRKLCMLLELQPIPIGGETIATTTTTITANDEQEPSIFKRFDWLFGLKVKSMDLV